MLALLLVVFALGATCDGAGLPDDWMSRLDPKILEEGLKKATPSADVLAQEARTMFHGDITVEAKDMLQDESGEKPLFLLGKLEAENFWPDRHSIPYEIEPSFNMEERTIIKRAMQGISTRTFGCIGFQERTTEPDYISFQKTPGVCRSSVGRRGGKQNIDLAPNCAKTLGNVQHEIMHSLGIFHEQSRPDRDNYVQLNNDNIYSLMLDNFEKLPMMDTYNVGYDLTSVMHYGFNDFARNKSLPTIIPKKASRVKMGQRNGISLLDATKLQMAYGCPFDNDDNATPAPTRRSTKPLNVFNDNVDSPATSAPTSAWRKYGKKCYFFSFLSDTKPERTFKEAQQDCRKLKSKIVDPEEVVDVINFIEEAITVNLATQSSARVWTAGCKSLTRGDTETKEEENCNEKLHYICQNPTKKENCDSKP